jgi:hypothetical protein
MPVLINPFIIVTYLKSIIDNVDNNAKRWIPRLISLVYQLKECHCESASIKHHPAMVPLLHRFDLSYIQLKKETDAERILWDDKFIVQNNSRSHIRKHKVVCHLQALVSKVTMLIKTLPLLSFS